MKKEIRDKWVEELRSRPHEQGQGYLHYKKPDGTARFCALGILCDIAEKEGVVTSTFFNNPGVWKYEGEARDWLSFPPTEVTTWSGMDKDYGATGEIAYQNDSGTPFAHIADWIEKNL